MPSEFDIGLPNLPEFPDGLPTREICKLNGLQITKSNMQRVQMWLAQEVEAGRVLVGRAKVRDTLGCGSRTINVYKLTGDVTDGKTRRSRRPATRGRSGSLDVR